ncbi:MAG: alpha/beta hydrolase family protein, partial [Opitutaceae bacterium]
RLPRRRALEILGLASLPFSFAPGFVARAASSPTSAPMSSPVPPVPDLVNLHPLLETMAREHAPRMSFLEARWKSLDEWKSAAREVLLDRLGYQPSARPPGAELVRREERDGFSVEVVRIHATEAYSIPARVLVPAGKAGRRPAVLALHCHSGRYTWGHEKVLSAPGEPAFLTTFREGTYARPWAEALARRGYVVIAIDAFYFGERRLRVEDLDPARVFPEVRDAHATVRRTPPGSEEWTAAVNKVCGFYEHLTAKAITATGATWGGIHVWDDRRAIDYLCTRPDVDPGRVGCAGLSGGGFRTAMAIGADPRIKAACVSGWMTGFADLLPQHLRHTWMVFTPGLRRALDLPDVAALHAPGALLVQQCRRDHLFPLPGMEAAVGKIGRVYAKAGVPERFRGSFHDVPHSFLPTMQEEAFAWLDRWL